MTFVDTDTGELFTGCPHCEQTRAECDMLASATERDLRSWKIRATKAENKLEAQTASRHSKKDWETILGEWQGVFPDVPKPRSASIKSARANEVFTRLDHGAMVDDVLNAIHGAKQRPYLRYGRRCETSGPNTERAVDLAQIVKVTGAHSDGNFDLLAAEGAKLRGAAF